MSGWGTGWLSPENKAELAKAEQDTLLYGTGAHTTQIDDNGNLKIEHVPIHDIPQFLNKKPTHDPYTNPNAQLYYECNCGQILDPGTKSFAELNNCASKAGWKIRFGEYGYTPYCVECGRNVE